MVPKPKFKRNAIKLVEKNRNLRPNRSRDIMSSKDSPEDKDDTVTEVVKTSEAATKCKKLALEMAEQLKSIDPNFERSSRFVRDIQSSFSSYEQLIKTKIKTQKQVTDFFKPKETNDCTVEQEIDVDSPEIFISDDEALNESEEELFGSEKSVDYANDGPEEERGNGAEESNEAAEIDLVWDRDQHDGTFCSTKRIEVADSMKEVVNRDGGDKQAVLDGKNATTADNKTEYDELMDYENDCVISKNDEEEFCLGWDE